MHCSSCVRRVMQVINALPGTHAEEVRVGAARVTTDADPAQIEKSLERCRLPGTSPSLIARAMSEQTLQIAGMSCAACQHHVERALRSVPGVESASVSLLANSAQINSAQPLDVQPLIEAVRHAGYDASLPVPQHHATTGHAEHVHDSDEPALGLRTLLSLIAGAVAMMLSMPLMMANPSADPLLNLVARVLGPLTPAALMSLPAQPLRWFLCALSFAVMLFAAPEIYVGAWRATRHRTTNMNTLIAIGTLSAFAASLVATIRASASGADVYFESVILILGFLLAGRWLEARARRQATRSIRGFAQLTAATARLLDVDLAAGNPDYSAAHETRPSHRCTRRRRYPPRPRGRSHPRRRHHSRRPQFSRRVHAHRRTIACDAHAGRACHQRHTESRRRAHPARDRGR